MRKASPSHVQQVRENERPRMQHDRILTEVFSYEVHHTPVIATGAFHERLCLNVVRDLGRPVARRTVETTDVAYYTQSPEATLLRLSIDILLADSTNFGIAAVVFGVSKFVLKV